MNLLFLDTETTGLDPITNDVIEIGFILECDGEIKKQASFKVQPHSYENISEEAMKVNNIVIDELKKAPKPEVGLKLFVKLLKKYLPENPRNDEKLIMVAHNAKFDYGMMKHWFLKGGMTEKDFDSLISYHCIDTVAIAALFSGWGPLKGKVKSFSLGALTKFFNIEFDGAQHTAGADIKATYELFHVFTDYFQSE